MVDEFVLYTAKGVFQIEPGHVNCLRVSFGMAQDFMDTCVVISAAADALEKSLLKLCID